MCNRGVSKSRISIRARNNRLRTVPTGRSKISAISSYRQPSISRSTNICRYSMLSSAERGVDQLGPLLLDHARFGGRLAVHRLVSHERFHSIERRRLLPAPRVAHGQVERDAIQPCVKCRRRRGTCPASCTPARRRPARYPRHPRPSPARAAASCTVDPGTAATKRPKAAVSPAKVAAMSEASSLKLRSLGLRRSGVA